jgi:uncharacterized membrane protein YgcG
MSYGKRWRMVGMGLLLGLLCAGRAGAVAPEIKDEAKFFSEDAVKKANKQIREIARKYDKDLLIETVAGVPADQAERVKDMSAAERDKFMRNWAEDRADAAVVRGVYILVVKDPAHLQIVVTRKSGLTDKARRELRDLLVKDFREKRYDEGLEAAVKYVQEKLAAQEK